MQYLFVFLALVVSAAALAEPEKACYQIDDIVGASYTIANEGIKESEREFVVLRQTEGRLIYLAPEVHLTQVYERYSDTQVKLIEYFDLEAIGVEHEPAMSKPPEDWLSMYQIFPVTKLAELQKTGESRVNCLQATAYAGTDSSGTNVAVTYLPEINLPLSIKRESESVTKIWQLNRLITSRAEIDQVVSRINGYITYDFADLGDSEHEEFFRSSRYLQYKLGHAH